MTPWIRRLKVVQPERCEQLRRSVAGGLELGFRRNPSATLRITMRQQVKTAGPRSAVKRSGNGRGKASRYPLPILDKLKRIAAKVPREEWRRLPADLTDNLDHYLYGLPKK